MLQKKMKTVQLLLMMLDLEYEGVISVTKIRLKLETSTDVRRTLKRVMNMVVNGEIDTKKANTIILGCNAVLSSIRIDEQQKKIDELERILKDV